MNTEEIKSRYSMRDILEKYGLPQPNRSGFIHCPFHKRDREPSMKIYDRDFHCYACGANGDIFTFVQRMDGISFKEAFQELGGIYEHDFSSRIKMYRARKEREMQKKAEEQHKKKRELNSLLISVYRKFMERSEPLSDTWCECYNALQYQIYMNEILNSPEEKNGAGRKTE